MKARHDQRGRAGRHRQAGGDDDGEEGRGGPSGGLHAGVADGQPVPHPGHEEDRIVRDDPHEQDDQNRFELLRDRHAEPLSGPRHHSAGDHERQGSRRKHQQRRAHGAVRHRQDERHEQDRGQFDPDQCSGDQGALFRPGRRGAGDADQVIVRPVDLRPGELLRFLDLREQALVGAEEQERQRGRSPLPRARHEAERVDQRDGSGDLAKLGVAMPVQQEGPLDHPGLGLDRQPPRIALDHDGPGQDRDAEQPVRSGLHLEGGGVLGDEVRESLLLGPGQWRQIRDGRDGCGDPAANDQPSKGHDHPSDGPGDQAGGRRLPAWWRGLSHAQAAWREP